MTDAPTYLIGMDVAGDEPRSPELVHPRCGQVRDGQADNPEECDRPLGHPGMHSATVGPWGEWLWWGVPKATTESVAITLGDSPEVGLSTDLPSGGHRVTVRSAIPSTVRIKAPDGATLLDFHAATGDVVIHEESRLTEAALIFWREVQRIAQVGDAKCDNCDRPAEFLLCEEHDDLYRDALLEIPPAR